MDRNTRLFRPAEPHPFRRQIAFARLRRASRARAGVSAQDVREFLMAYCACFVAVSAYIA